MDIALIEINRSGDNKDYNNGFGTTFDISGSLQALILKKTRKHYENFPTLSYAYISAGFKKYGHNVTYYQNTIPDKCSLALINGTAIRFQEEQSVIQTINQNKKYPIGVFGSLPTIHPELYSTANFLIRGEPENIVENIASTAVIPSGILPYTYAGDLNSLSFPDWDIYNIRQFSYAPLLPGKPFAFIQKSRGCPFQCSYCPHNPLKEYRKIENVMEEIRYLKNRYHIHTLHFKDSCFMLTDNEMTFFHDFLQKEKIKIHWGMETRIDLLDKDKIDFLYETGLRAIKVGIENASLTTLQKHQRNFDSFAHAKELIHHCRKKGIRTNACYILGFPEEKLADVKQTIKLAQEIHSSFCNFFILTPLPGTDFESDAKLNIIDTNWEHRDNFHLVFKHPHFTNEELKKIQSDAICRYYFRPRWLSGHIMERLKTLIYR